MSVEAQYAGTCEACAGRIEPGELIEFVRYSGGWMHEVCPPGRMDIVREICSECFTERSVTGACMCEQVTA